MRTTTEKTEDENVEEYVVIKTLKDKKTFKLGKVEGNDYINKSAGFKITGLDEKWVQSTPEQISTIYDSGIDEATGKAYSSNSTDGSQNYLYDVLYTNSDSDEVISVSLLEYDGENELDNEIPDYEGSDTIDGFNDSSELLYLDVAGRKTACKKVSYVKTNNVANIPNITEYEFYMMSASKQQVIKIVIVCFEGQDGVEEILKHFVSTENE